MLRTPKAFHLTAHGLPRNEATLGTIPPNGHNPKVVASKHASMGDETLSGYWNGGQFTQGSSDFVGPTLGYTRERRCRSSSNSSPTRNSEEPQLRQEAAGLNAVVATVSLRDVGDGRGLQNRHPSQRYFQLSDVAQRRGYNSLRPAAPTVPQWREPWLLHG